MKKMLKLLERLVNIDSGSRLVRKGLTGCKPSWPKYEKRGLRWKLEHGTAETP